MNNTGPRYRIFLILKRMILLEYLSPYFTFVVKTKIRRVSILVKR